MAALSFPLSIADFYDTICVGDVSFDLPESQINSGVTGKGEILPADIGSRLWTGQVTVRPLLTADARAVLSRISTLKQAGRAFFVFDKRHAGPRMDPKGVILGASTPQIKSVNANNRQLVIKGLPIGYVLSAGDYIAFAYGSNPTRYALHDLAVGGTANSSGEVEVEVSNFIRSGAAADQDITLIKPSCKAVLVPGTIEPGSAPGRFHDGISFSWRQTLR